LTERFNGEAFSLAVDNVDLVSFPFSHCAKVSYAQWNEGGM